MGQEKSITCIIGKMSLYNIKISIFNFKDIFLMQVIFFKFAAALTRNRNMRSMKFRHLLDHILLLLYR